VFNPHPFQKKLFSYVRINSAPLWRFVFWRRQNVHTGQKQYRCRTLQNLYGMCTTLVGWRSH
jgi:hypothetical protein